MMPPDTKVSTLPGITVASLPNWTEIADSDDSLQTGFLPNLRTVAFAKILEQSVGENLGIIGWSIVIINDVKLSTKSTEKTRGSERNTTRTSTFVEGEEIRATFNSTIIWPFLKSVGAK
jgi:hypothetical protein